MENNKYEMGLIFFVNYLIIYVIILYIYIINILEFLIY